MTGTKKAVKKILRLLLNVALLIGILLLCGYLTLDREETLYVLGTYLVLRLILRLVVKTARAIRHSAKERRERRREDPAGAKRKRSSFARAAAILLAGLFLLGGAIAVKN